MLSSTALGDEFELNVLDLLKREIANDRFYFKRECCQVFHKKGYYSEDRKDEIIFDIAIELTTPGADQYSSLVLIECKRLSRPVEVGDLQLFFSSIEQIAGARDKGIVVSSGGFTKQALEFARSKGIGLARYFPEDGFKWQLRRSPVGSRWTDSDASEIERGLLINEYEHANSPFYCFAPASPVQTFNELLAALVGEAVDAALVQRVQSADVVVQFLSREDIDRETESILDAVSYQGGPAPLEDIERQHGLHVIRGATAGPVEQAGNILGRVAFGPSPTITLYDHPGQPPSRGRFTLTHEFGHCLLGHGQYVAAEYCDARDHDYGLDRRMSRVDIKRSEWQANYFASVLLMPREFVERDVTELAKKLDLKDRGHGLIYVDNQPVNLGVFYRVTSELKQRYQVSRTVVRHRLKGLGLLNDARDDSMRRLGDGL